MTTARRIEGEPVAVEIRQSLDNRVRALVDRGVTPTLATVLASDAPADQRFVELKHEAAAAVGIDTRDVRIAPSAPSTRLEAAVHEVSMDPAVTAVFVQAPLPEQADELAVRTAVDPRKDVDCFHPENLGRLVVDDPRFTPATPAAVVALFSHYGIETAGRDVVVVGRSSIIGRPLFNLLLRREVPGNATVTVCHSRTRDLGAKTRGADVVVTAVGQPGVVDGSMLADGATVIDVSATRTTEGGEVSYVGDVDAESAATVAGALTPVPGGVGPVTVAMLLSNVVLATERRTSGVTPVTDGPP